MVKKQGSAFYYRNNSQDQEIKAKPSWFLMPAAPSALRDLGFYIRDRANGLDSLKAPDSIDFAVTTWPG